MVLSHQGFGLFKSIFILSVVFQKVFLAEALFHEAFILGF